MKKVGIVVAVLLVLGILVVPLVVIVGGVLFGFFSWTVQEPPPPPVTWHLEAPAELPPEPLARLADHVSDGVG